LVNPYYNFTTLGAFQQKILALRVHAPIICPNNEPQDPFSKNTVKSRVLDMRTWTTDVRM